MPASDPSPEAGSRSPLLAWALRVAAVTLVLGCAAAQYLSRYHGASERRVAVAAPLPEPETTGSIGGGARSVTLDPCALAGRIRGSAH
ncbi:hypothetical protein U8607_23035 [Methylobacterium durans]|uniref:hypothetical protein n=1 Tax=Methylobacterium durans TaxID=2202825 RepID=UPI002B001570|nr:hypothetical protein [Methylobacterium durans]MEA1834974.1 hypothetical protein [Methylobacterium durans]